MTKGTLRMLIHRDSGSDNLGYDLRWSGRPEGEGPYWWDDMPERPSGSGLWLLSRDWVMDEENKTYAYAPACEWRRPTLADLIALGALPEEGR